MIYTPPYQPRVKQREALAKMGRAESFGLLMAMRTGKTKTLLDNYGDMELAGSVENLGVIAPGGVYKTWEGQIREHLSADLNRRLTVHVWRSGSGAMLKRERKAFLAAPNPRALLINVEALSSVKEAREMLEAFLRAAPAMLAIDESTIIKNPSAKRTKFVLKMGDLAKYRRILSGLPNPKNPLDLYSQFEFLDWRILGFRSYYAFRNRFAKLKDLWLGGRMVKVVDGFQNLEELHRLIEPYTFRCLLEDCYDLPPKMFDVREVPLTPEQERLYEEMREFATAEIGSGANVSATIVIAQIIRLHQILCGHVRDELGNEHEIPENRTAALLDLLEEYDGKAIVWASYDADVTRIHAALTKAYGEGSTARFWGGNRASREAEEVRFKNDPACRWMVATAAAGGRGREWSNADLVIYYSNTADLEHRLQSEDRPQAVGKTRSVLYVDLMTRGTVDEKMIWTLRNKMTISSAVMGDGYREWLI